MIELEFNEDGFLEDGANSVRQITRYGGLTAKRLEAQRIGGLLLLQFRGYDEARARFQKLQGRQFVVKLTGESDAGLVRTQVVQLNDEGIVVFVGRPRTDESDEFKELVATQFGRDFKTTALHVEISAFDDPEVENFTVSKVLSLTEDA